jgi:hypothetical protein
MSGIALFFFQCVDGFMLVLNQRGILLFATESLNDDLGHPLVSHCPLGTRVSNSSRSLSQVDVLGTSFYKLIHPDDVETLRKQFVFRSRDEDIEAGEGLEFKTFLLLNCVFVVLGSSQIPVTSQRSFHLRILNRQNVTNNQQPPKYDYVHLVGHLKRMDPIQASISHPGNRLFHLKNISSEECMSLKIIFCCAKQIRYFF